MLLLGLLLLFAHAAKARFQNPAVEVWFHQPSIRSLTSDHDSLFRLPDFFREGKAPNQPNDELLLHQGGPRAALHANQLRITGLAAQHPSITVSALSRDTSTAGRIFLFPFVEGFGFGVALGVAFAFCSCDQGPLSESCGGSLVPPTIYPVTDFRP